MKKLLFIYNPNAGKGKIREHLSSVLKIFEENDYLVTQYKTKAPLDAEREARERGSDYDLIVCFGGDGTLSEVASGVCELDVKPPIGFIPAGSTNDTAGSYNIPTNIEEAALIAVTGRPFKTDLGFLGDKSFVYVASFGDISAVSAFTPQDMKRRFGHLAYVAEGMKVIPNMKFSHMTIEYDGTTIEGEFFLGMITNSLQVGGFKGITGKSVDLQDGLFEVLLLKKPRNIIDFAEEVGHVLIKKDDESHIASVGKTGYAEDQYDLIHKFKAAHIKFIADEEVQWVVDGEDAGRHKEIEIQNKNKVIEIMVKD